MDIEPTTAQKRALAQAAAARPVTESELAGFRRAAQAIRQAVTRTRTRTRTLNVSVGTVRLPLHGSADGSAAKMLAHQMAMQEMAGVNHLGEPKGFRIAPTSKKNPRTHKKGPQTRIEALTRQAMKEGAFQ